MLSAKWFRNPCAPRADSGFEPPFTRKIQCPTAKCWSCLVTVIAITILLSSCNFVTGPKLPSDWKQMESGTAENLRGVWGFASGEVFAVGENGTILHFDGTQWITMESQTTADLVAVWGSDPSHVLATGDEGTILYYDGATWSPMASGTTAPIGKMWGVPTPDPGEFPFWVYAVGGGPPGTILRFNEFGWQAIDTGAGEDLIDIVGWVPPFEGGPPNRFVLLAVGESGTARTYDGDAWSEESWNETVTGTEEDLVAVIGDFPDNVYAVGRDGTVIQNTARFVETGPPTSWREVAALGGYGLADIEARHYNDLFLVGESGRILNFDRLAFNDMRSHSSAALHALWSGTTDVFAVGDNGTILRYSKPPSVKVCPINVRVFATGGTTPVIRWSPPCPVSKVVVEDDWGAVLWFIEADGNLIQPGITYGATPPGTIARRPGDMPLFEDKLYRVILIRRGWDTELVVGQYNLIPQLSEGPATVTSAPGLGVPAGSDPDARVFYFQRLRLMQAPPPEICSFDGLIEIVDGAWRMAADPVERESLLNIRPAIVEYARRDPDTGYIEVIRIDNIRVADLPMRGSSTAATVVWDVINGN